MLRETNVPPGDGMAKVTWKLAVWLGPTVTPAGRIICETLEMTVLELPMNPGAVAEMIVVPIVPPGLTTTLTPVAPARTVTVACTVAAAGLLLARLTTWPLTPAGAASMTASVPGPEVNVSVLGDSVIIIADAVIVTVEGLLLTSPSFTIN